MTPFTATDSLVEESFADDAFAAGDATGFAAAGLLTFQTVAHLGHFTFAIAIGTFTVVPQPGQVTARTDIQPTFKTYR
ncbi:MAG: hypothetical protein ACR2NZ_23290 [Rubripirellula sp.]